MAVSDKHKSLKTNETHQKVDINHTKSQIQMWICVGGVLYMHPVCSLLYTKSLKYLSALVVSKATIHWNQYDNIVIAWTRKLRLYYILQNTLSSLQPAVCLKSDIPKYKFAKCKNIFFNFYNGKYEPFSCGEKQCRIIIQLLILHITSKNKI